MKLLKPVSTFVLLLTLLSISGCSASEGIKAEDKEVLGEFCSDYQNYASNSVERAGKSTFAFIDLTPIINSYDNDESIDSLKSAMVDVKTHFSWVEAELLGYDVEFLTMTDAEQVIQGAVDKTPPIGVFEVEANLTSACSKFTK
jgi:hypothetical protein